MPRYRYVGEGRAYIPDAFAEVDPGEEFDSPIELNNPTLVPVDAIDLKPTEPPVPVDVPDSAPAPAPAPESTEEVSE